MTHMLEIRGLTKKFGPATVVDDISFTVDRGEVLGFLGPNGAGKSTTMKMVTGYLPITAGTASVCGYDVAEDPIQVKRHIGYLPEGAPLYEDMTPAAMLNFVAEVRGFRGAEKDAAVARAASMIHIEEVMEQSIGTLSKGYKRRVGLAQAILHDPDVLILDEPTDGLDPNQKFEVRQLINAMSKNKAIIISTHLLEEVDAVCTRAIIISRGRIVADGTPEDLESRSRFHNAVCLCVSRDTADRAHSEISSLDGVASVEIIEEAEKISRLMVHPKDGRFILQEIGACVRAAGLEVEEIRAERGHLDDVFRQITTSAQG